MSSVKSTDVTCKTHSGQLAAKLPSRVNLASLVCDMDLRPRCRVSALVRSPVVEIMVYTAW